MGFNLEGDSGNFRDLPVHIAKHVAYPDQVSQGRGEGRTSVPPVAQSAASIGSLMPEISLLTAQRARTIHLQVLSRFAQSSMEEAEAVLIIALPGEIYTVPGFYLRSSSITCPIFVIA